MKFKDYISRILVCSFLLSMYASCFVEADAMDGFDNTENASAARPVIPKSFDDKNAEFVIVNQNDQKNNRKTVDQEDCYICKEDPYSYFLPSFTPENISKDDLANARLMKCPNCGKFFHDICVWKWVSAVSQTWNTKKQWFCPSCDKRRIERNNKKDKLLDLQIKELEEKNEEQNKEKNKVNDIPHHKKPDDGSKQSCLILPAGALVLGLALGNSGKTEVHVHCCHKN